MVSDRAKRHWVSDITCVGTAQGWLYLAVVLDLYSRADVGWAMHHRMQQALVHADRCTPADENRGTAALGSSPLDVGLSQSDGV